MKVVFNSLGNVYSPPSKTVKQKPVSFCGADEYVQGALNPQTYKEARKALQREYLPQLAQLRQEERTHWQDVCSRVCEEQFKDKNLGKFDDFIKKMKGFRDAKIKSSLSESVAMLDNMDFEESYRFGQGTRKSLDSFMITSKDKKLAEDFLDFSQFWSKVRSLGDPESFGTIVDPYKWAYGLDYRKIKGIENPDKLKKAIVEALENSRKNFEKTGRKTILHVENMESILTPLTYPNNDYIKTKDLLPYSNSFHKALITFTNTDSDKISQAGIYSFERIGIEFNLDEHGIAQADLNVLKKYQKDLQPTIDNISAIYQEGGSKRHQIVTKMSRLKKEFKQKMAELNERFPKEMRNASTNLQTPTPEPEVIKKLSKTKVGLIIAAAATAFGGGILLYKKFGKKNAAPQGIPEVPATPVATPTVSPQAIMQQTPAAQLLTQYSAPLTMQDFLKQNS